MYDVPLHMGPWTWGARKWKKNGGGEEEEERGEETPARKTELFESPPTDFQVIELGCHYSHQ